jgi:23S rRNA (guanosine2251-2'-O)-methyltransferase
MNKPRKEMTKPPDLLYGVNAVIEALRAGARPIHKVLVAKGVKPHRLQEMLQLIRAAGIPVQLVERNALDRVSAGGAHQGVVAQVAAHSLADAEALLDEITPDSLLVVLDEVEDPHNLGAIIRTAYCAGARAVVITKHRSAGLTQVVAKASAGAVEYLPVMRVTNLASFMEALKDRGVHLVGVEASGQQEYGQLVYPRPLALVFGSEGRGLRRLTAEKCDTTVFIPMAGRINSLNVSVAVGVVLFEARRQWQSARATDGAIKS